MLAGSGRESDEEDEGGAGVSGDGDDGGSDGDGPRPPGTLSTVQLETLVRTPVSHCRWDLRTIFDKGDQASVPHKLWMRTCRAARGVVSRPPAFSGQSTGRAGHRFRRVAARGAGALSPPRSNWKPQVSLTLRLYVFHGSDPITSLQQGQSTAQQSLCPSRASPARSLAALLLSSPPPAHFPIEAI